MACDKGPRCLRVFVYRNLNQPGRVFSIRDVETGKVIAHTEGCLLRDARFKVSERGRQRVIRQRRKNVHAGVEGVLILTPTLVASAMRRLKRQVRYDPYSGPDFTYLDGTPIKEAKAVLFSNGKVFV